MPAHKTCRTLVLAPTRELASQIADSFRSYGRFLGLSTTVVFGASASASRSRRSNAASMCSSRRLGACWTSSASVR
ncbi:MAG: DEAD/DEAH box helicase [Terricaulis sp.]